MHICRLHGGKPLSFWGGSDVIVFGVNFDGRKTGDELVMSIFEKEKEKIKLRVLSIKQCLKAIPKINEEV